MNSRIRTIVTFAWGLVFLVAFASWGQNPPLPQSSGSIAYIVLDEKFDEKLRMGGFPTSDIFLLDVASGARKKLTHDPLPVYWRLDWSPDGRKLAFSLNKGGRLDIYVMDADGQKVLPITQNGISYDPAWSPDGTQIAYTAVTQLGASQIYAMNADGTKLKNLTNDDSTNNAHPDWSPDGRRIVFVSQAVGEGGRKVDIYLMDADGKNRRRLAGTEHIDWEPAFSPDGRQIIFSSGDGSINRVDANGENFKRLFHRGFSPVWSPDGQEIAFVSLPERQIYRMRVDGGDVRPLINDRTFKGGLSWTARRPLAVSPQWNLKQTIWGWIKAKGGP